MCAHANDFGCLARLGGTVGVRALSPHERDHPGFGHFDRCGIVFVSLEPPPQRAYVGRAQTHVRFAASLYHTPRSGHMRSVGRVRCLCRCNGCHWCGGG